MDAIGVVMLIEGAEVDRAVILVPGKSPVSMTGAVLWETAASGDKAFEKKI